MNGKVTPRTYRSYKLIYNTRKSVVKEIAHIKNDIKIFHNHTQLPDQDRIELEKYLDENPNLPEQVKSAIDSKLAGCRNRENQKMWEIKAYGEDLKKAKAKLTLCEITLELIKKRMREERRDSLSLH